MNKELALDIIKLLSALESFALCQDTRVPSYLSDELANAVEKLSDIVLETEKNAADYT